MFETSEKSEVIYTARLMQSRLNIYDEEVITQGDEAEHMYLIIRGKVTVLQNYSHVDANYELLTSVLNAQKKFHNLLKKTKVIGVKEKKPPIIQNKLTFKRIQLKHK